MSKSRVSKIRKSGRKTTDSAPWILSFWLLCFVTVAWGQDPVPKRPDRAALIASAESAAPEAIAKHATIVDWPAKPAGHFVMVRQGDNGWTCMPDRLDTPANDPMCMDAVWMEWMHAALEGRPAKIDRVGLAYMLQGGSAADQRDPFRTSPPPGKETYFVGPHIMVLLPDIKQLAGVSHDVYNGGPFVEALERDHPIILMPVAPPKTKLNVLPSDKPVLTNP